MGRIAVDGEVAGLGLEPHLGHEAGTRKRDEGNRSVGPKPSLHQLPEMSGNTRDGGFTIDEGAGSLVHVSGVYQQGPARKNQWISPIIPLPAIMAGT